MRCFSGLSRAPGPVYTSAVASALIRIDQAANTIPNGVAGIARDDILLGSIVTVRNGTPNGVRTRRWVLDRPFNSEAILSTTTGEAPTFTPDVVGTYLIKLSVNDGLDMGEDGDEVDERSVIVRDAAGHRHPATEEGKQSNYATGPGVFNKEGWSPDLRRMLQAYDNRNTDPLTVTVASGDSEDVSVVLPPNMDECVLQYLRITSTSSTDTTVKIYANSLLVLQLSNIDASAGYRTHYHVTIADDADKLADHTFTIEVTNNDGASSDYQIYLRVKAT